MAKFWENGFHLEQNKNETRKQISEEEWQRLLEGQSQGLEIYTNNDGLPDLRMHEATEEELQERRKYEIQSVLDSLNQDIVQDAAGEVVPGIEEKKLRFINLHNELRVMLGKEKRRLKNG